MKIELLHKYEPTPEIQRIIDNILDSSKYAEFAIDKLRFISDNYGIGVNDELAQTTYRQLYERAVELKCENSLAESAETIGKTSGFEFWALPKSLQADVNYQQFPVNMLPDVLKNYIQAVSEYGQVPVEMCFLPMMSVLSRCVIGKAKVKNHKSSYTYELPLYTLTVAPSSARKSPSLKYFLKPCYDYQKKYNELHSTEIKQRHTERQFYENEKQKVMKGKSPNLNRAKEIDEILNDLPELHTMSFTVTDVTTEALANAMNEHDGIMAILDSEGGCLRTWGGMYNGGQSNVDLLLKAYDGDYVEIWRKTSGTIVLPHPLLSIGLLTQPKRFNEFMNNADFSESGLLNRFLFAFPTAPTRYTDTVPEIPEKYKEDYAALIDKLLRLPESDAVIKHNYKAIEIFHDLHDDIQAKKQSGGIFELIPDYAEKQFANAMKIAAILHLCEHDVTEPIDERTALRTTQIMMWLFNQALLAFNKTVGESAEIQNIKRICTIMSDGKYQSARDISRKLKLKSDDVKELLETLIENYYVKTNGKEPSERGCQYILNPIICK